MLTLQHIDHVAIAVRDVRRSLAWYQEVLGLDRRFADAWGDYPAVVCAGETCVALFPVDGPNPKPVPGRDTIGMRHFAFRVDRAGFRQAQEHFRDLETDFRLEDHGIARSIYVADPDGHTIEITTYDSD